MLRMLTDEHLCSFAHIVRVDNATNKRERIKGKYAFPCWRVCLFFFFQENGYSSLKNVSKMYQRCKIMNICIRSVCVLFWKIGHMWKHNLLVTNWGVGREAVCVMLWTSVWLEVRVIKRNHGLLKNQNEMCHFQLGHKLKYKSTWQFASHNSTCLTHTGGRGGPCTSSLPPLLDLPDLVFWHVVECNVLY